MISNPFRITESESLIDGGDICFFHNKKATQSGAFELQEKAGLELKIPRSLGTKSIKINIFTEDRQKLVLSVYTKYKDSVLNFDIYDAHLPIDNIGVGLYFFNVEIYGIVGTTYASKANDGLSFSKNSYPQLQLSVSDFKYKIPQKHLGGIIYHIFVDRFSRGKKTETKEGDVFIEDWNAPIPEFPEYPGAPLKNNYFYGGSLWGISEKLDYISALGVSAIYLSPIFDSASNHKYDTGDYMQVDKAFGGDEALSHLIKKAKKLGISIILDGVFNHTGADSIYFNRYGKYKSLGAYQSPKSQYYSWYDFKEYPNSYTSWWGIEILPRINPDASECRSFFVGKGGVIEKYSRMGISGIRLDVADELSDEFIEEIKAKLNEYDSESVLYGEVWEDASNKIAYDKRKKYYLGTELDGVMNYPVRRGIIDFLSRGATDTLRYALTDVTENAPKRIRDIQMNLIGTHDTERIITVLGGESSIGKTNKYLSEKKMNSEEYALGKQRLLLAYTILATLPGIPAIFYGDEAGLEGYSDPFNRRTFPWENEDKEILDFYQKIGKIRREHTVYKDGEFKLLHLTPDLLIFSRSDDKHAYVTVINNSRLDVDISLSRSALSLIEGKKSTRHKILGGASAIFKTTKNTILQF